MIQIFVVVWWCLLLYVNLANRDALRAPRSYRAQEAYSFRESFANRGYKLEFEVRKCDTDCFAQPRLRIPIS
jgi:hypothetical protein